MKRKIFVTPPLPAGLHLQFKGIWNMDETYKRMKFYLDFNGFGGDNFEEKEYWQSEKGDIKKLEIRWYGEKKISDYFTYVLKIQFLVLGMKNIEIEKDGKKMKMQQGQFETRTEAHLLCDTKEIFKNKTIQNIYEDFLMKKRIDGYKKDLYEKLEKFLTETKRFLELREY